MIIDFEKVNSQVEAIEEKKRAIEEAAKCGIKALDSQKPKAIKSLSIGKTKVVPIVYGNGSYSNEIQIFPSGVDIRRPISQYSDVTVSFDKDDLLSLAACIIKAFGPIHQDLIDKVEVEW